MYAFIFEINQKQFFALRISKREGKKDPNVRGIFQQQRRIEK
jgi:hypothetical protein